MMNLRPRAYGTQTSLDSRLEKEIITRPWNPRGKKRSNQSFVFVSSEEISVSIEAYK